MTKKESVDNYFQKYYSEIKDLKEKGVISWKVIAEKISFLAKETIDPEYIRKRFAQFKPKCLEDKCTKGNCVCKGLITQDINSIINTTSILPGYFKYTYQEDRDKGTAKLEDNVTEKPTDEEIFVKYNIDPKEFKISQIWFKDQAVGYRMSVLFSSIKKSTTASEIDFKKEFTDFVNNKNIAIFKNNTSAKYWQEDKIQNKELSHTVVINIADLHLGKLVSEAETGERYNLEIAKKRFLDCIKYLSLKAYQCYGVKKFILSTLGDTLHTDSLKSTTTAGTYVESDTRASKVFQTALELISEGIEILKQYAPEVEFININGNHCELSEQHLGIALKAYYRNDTQVSINAEPRNRKHKLVGKNLLTWCHGDTNANTLPLTVATEVPQMWGESAFRIIQLGHLHSSKKKVHQSEDEFNGVVVRHFSSISGTDAWHDKNNFTGNQKRGTALIFSDKEPGILGEFYKTV